MVAWSFKSLFFVALLSSSFSYSLNISDPIFQESFKTGLATGVIPGIGQVMAVHTVFVDLFGSPLIDNFVKNEQKRRELYQTILDRGIAVEFAAVVCAFMIFKKVNVIYSGAAALGVVGYGWNGVPYLTENTINALSSSLKTKGSVARGIFLGHLAGIISWGATVYMIQKLFGNSAAIMLTSMLAVEGLLEILVYQKK